MHKGLAIAVLCFWITLLAILFYEITAYASSHSLNLLETLKALNLLFQERLIVGHGILTPLLFILAFIVRPLLFFPAALMTMTTVMILGPIQGFVIAYIGEMASSSLTYFIGRYFGEEFGLTKKVQKSSIGKYFRGNAIISILVLRIIPLFPFDVINYSSGVFKIPFKKYVLATLLGLSPGLIVFIFLSSSITHRELLPLAITSAITLILVGLLIKERYLIQKLA